MKKSLLLASALLCAASSFAQDMTIAPDGEDVKRNFDTAQYEKFGEFELRNRWMISRFSDGDDKFLEYLPESNMACSVVLDTTVYVCRPDNGSLLKFGLASGRYLGEIKLTYAEDGTFVNPERVTGSKAIAHIYNVTKDSFGHIVFHGYVASMGMNADTGAEGGIALYYISDLETGACTKAGDLMVPLEDLTKSYAVGRIDFSSIVGDVTRKEAHAIVMAAGCAGCGTQIYRWKCEQGSDVWKGDFPDKDNADTDGNGEIDPDVIMLSPIATDGNVTDWGGGSVCTIVQDEEYSGALFYIDGFNTIPALYDTNGNFVEGGTHTSTTTIDDEGKQVTTATRNVSSDWYPHQAGVNGIAEFTIEGTNFVCYANTQHAVTSADYAGGQVRIAKLGDNFEWAAEVNGVSTGAEMAWAKVPLNGLGNTSDTGRRIFNISATVVDGANGTGEGVYLMLNRCFNGIALYTIAKEGWQDPNGQVDGIEDIVADEVEGAAKYYNLQGVEIANPENGLYIVKRGNKVSKELVK